MNINGMFCVNRMRYLPGLTFICSLVNQDDEAVVIVPHCELVVFITFNAVADYVVDVLYSRVVVAFHLALYLVAVAVLSPFDGIEVHVDVAFLVLPVLQELLTEPVHLTDWL